MEDLTDQELIDSIRNKASSSSAAAAEDDPDGTHQMDPDGTKATIKGLLNSTYTSTDLALDAASLYSAAKCYVRPHALIRGAARRGPHHRRTKATAACQAASWPDEGGV